MSVRRSPVSGTRSSSEPMWWRMAACTRAARFGHRRYSTDRAAPARAAAPSIVNLA